MGLLLLAAGEERVRGDKYIGGPCCWVHNLLLLAPGLAEDHPKDLERLAAGEGRVLNCTCMNGLCCWVHGLLLLVPGRAEGHPMGLLLLAAGEERGRSDRYIGDPCWLVE
jgi:hypothetical protein